MKLWCNGVLAPADATRIDPSDRGFTLGDGVFETVRILHGKPVRLDRHLVRLAAGATLLGIPCPFRDEEIEAGCVALIAANAVATGSLRISLSRGPAPRGLASPAKQRPTMLIAAQAATVPSGPVTLIVAQSTRRNEHSPLSRIKSLNYLDNILARREAEARGAEDALLLNTTGRVAESTAATVIVLAEGRLWTPRLVDGALPGIARQLLMDAGLLAECAIEPAWLAEAAALFLCNSLGVRPVSSLDGRRLMERPEWLERLQAALLPQTARDPAAGA